MIPRGRPPAALQFGAAVSIELAASTHAHQAYGCHTRSPSQHRDRATGRSAQLHLPDAAVSPRSEEHTSELQSPCNLVCRLLLEKKKVNLRAYVMDQSKRYVEEKRMLA